VLRRPFTWSSCVLQRGATRSHNTPCTIMGKSAIHPVLVLCSLVAFAATCEAQMVSVLSSTHGTVFPLQNEVFWRTVSSAIHLLGMYLLNRGFRVVLRSIIMPRHTPDASLLPRTTIIGTHIPYTYAGVSILAYCLARRTDKFAARGKFMPPA
jgi:hypothetical protein